MTILMIFIQNKAKNNKRIFQKQIHFEHSPSFGPAKGHNSVNIFRLMRLQTVCIAIIALHRVISSICRERTLYEKKVNKLGECIWMGVKV